MAKEDVIGLAMQLDVSNIRQGVAEVNKLIKNSKQEFLNATAGMEKWQSTSEGLKSKLTQLNKQLDAQNKLVAGYKAEIERVSKLEGDHSKELDRLKDKLLKAEVEYKKTQSSIDKYSTSLEKVVTDERLENSTLGKLQKTMSEQRATLDRLNNEYKNAVLQYGKNSKEAKELARQIKAVSGSLEKNEAKLAKADKQLAKLSNTTAKTHKTFKETALTLTRNVAIAFTAVAGAIGGAVISAQNFAKRGDEIAKTAKVLGISTTALQELRYASEISGTSTEALSAGLQTLNRQIGAMKNGTGKFTSQLAEMDSQLAEEVLRANSTEEAFTLLTQAIAGETDQTKKAYLAQVAFGGASQEMIKLLDNGTEGIQQLRDEAHKYGNIMSEEATSKSEMFSDSMLRFKNVIQSIADTGLGMLVDKMQPLLESMAEYVAENKEFVSLKVEAVFNGIVKAVDLLINAFRSGLIGAIIKVIAVYKALILAQGALNVIMTANPIGLLIIALGALVVALVLLWKKSEDFRNFWKTTWDSCVGWTKDAIEAIGSFFTKAVDYGRTLLQNIWQGVKDTSQWLYDNILVVGIDFVKGLWQGITNTTQWLYDQIKGFCGGVVDKIKGFFGIHSPSTVMAEVGENLSAGLAVGMESGAKSEESVFTSIFNWLKDLFGETGKDILEAIGKALGIDFATLFGDGMIAGLKAEVPKVEKEAEKQAKEVIAGVEQELSKPTLWQRFVAGFKNALDKLNNMLAQWREGTGKYISQLGEVFDEVRNRVGGLTTAINDYYNAELQSRINAITEQQKKAQEAREAELAEARAEADKKVRLLQEQFDKQIISEEEFNESKKRIEEDYAKFEKEKQVEAEKQEMALNRKKDELARKQFEAQRTNAIAEALINGANAILKGFAQLGPIAGAINAGIQAGITALQVAVITKQKYVSAFAKGGVIDKPTLALMGEDGREAVMPLERNTGWITELAMKLKGIMEQDFALAGVNGTMQGAVINNYYYQTINSPTALSRKEIYRDTKNLLALKG